MGGTRLSAFLCTKWGREDGGEWGEPEKKDSGDLLPPNFYVFPWPNWSCAQDCRSNVSRRHVCPL